MKKFTIFPMASYKNKLFSLAVIGISLILLLVVSITGALPLIKLDANGQFNLFYGLATFGLYMVAWSKEKVEDERVQKVRAKAMQISFGYMISTLLAISFCSIISTAKSHNMALEGSDLMMYVSFILVVYLAVFYSALLFDPAWVYNDDTVMVNIKKNKQFFVVYTLAIIILFVFIFLFHKK